MVRFARDEDFDFVKTSWEVCFDDTREFVNWNFSKNYSPRNTVISEYANEPASVMQLMPYKLNINSHTFSACYVSGVATLPQFRKMGLVRELFNFALPAMYNMNFDISLLFPAVDGMYEKFGYQKVQSRSFYRTDKLPAGKVITQYSEDLIPLLDRIYKEAMSKKSCYILRCSWDWERILTDCLTLSKGSVVISESLGIADGYAVVYPKDNSYEVVEFCGNIYIDAEEIPQPPVLARVINADKINSVFKNQNTSDRFIPQNNSHADNTTDIAELTKAIFDNAKTSIGSDAYINLLL